MTPSHPRERTLWRAPTSRRAFLRLGAQAAAGAVLLNACSRTPDGGETAQTSPYAIGTREQPTEQPLFDDLTPIASGLPAEAGPLLIYNWDAYIDEETTLAAFSEEFGVDYELTTFYNMDEAIRKLSTGEQVADVFLPTADALPQFVAGKLLQPLNHDYVPNLEAHVWPQLADPYYDRGSRYSVPYAVYTTGIGWRTDLVDLDPSAEDVAWQVFWDPAHSGVAGLYDDWRESVSLALFRNGVIDANTADAAALTAAQDSLLELVDLMGMRYDIDGTYLKMTAGEYALHHAWSGDMVSAPAYMTEGSDPAVLRYNWPPRTGNGGGVIANDTITIPAGAPHPVLAHAFLDFMLRPENALSNFGWTGYQPPQTALDPDTLVADGYVLPDLAEAVVRETDFDLAGSQIPVQLSPEVQRLWLDAWATARAGG